MHRLVGKGIAWLGGLILLSAVAVNPWIGTYYQDHIENYADVMLNYVWWSLGLAGLLVGVGLMAAKRKSEGWTGAAMLLATVSLIVLADRALLVYFGLPYWVADPVVGYRHRPNAVRVLGSRMFPSKDNRLKGVRGGHQSLRTQRRRLYAAKARGPIARPDARRFGDDGAWVGPERHHAALARAIARRL